MVTNAIGVALISGGGRGIGAAIAAALAQSGFDIAIVSAEPVDEASEVLELVRGHGRRGIYRQADVGDIEQHDAIVMEVCHQLGELTCLVNNAGVTSLRRGSILELTPESFDRTLRVNLRAAFFLTQCVARQMRNSGHSPDQYRSIINISSVNAEIVGADRADYCVSKAGMSMMSKLFAAELASLGVNVFEVRPGIIRTAMTAPATAKYDPLIAAGLVPMRRWGSPDDVGQTVAALARGDLPFSTGEVINVGGGLQLHRL